MYIEAAVALGAYNNEDRVESVEMEDALKAGHCVEPVRGMQLCGVAAGMNNAMAVRRAVEASDAISCALTVPQRELKINEGFQNAQWCSGSIGEDLGAP